VDDGRCRGGAGRLKNIPVPLSRISHTFHMTIVLRTALVAVLVAVSTRADAQIFELVGTRAQGMGGAFVAVVDDATATWWNPAGLATGAYFSGVIERGVTNAPPDTAPGGAAWEAENSSFALVFPAFGVSYYRLRVNQIGPNTSTDEEAQGRQDPGVVGVRALSTRQFGATVGQSLGNHLVIGSTLRLIRQRAGVRRWRKSIRSGAAGESWNGLYEDDAWTGEWGDIRT
jgi:hypothetical protein